MNFVPKPKLVGIQQPEMESITFGKHDDFRRKAMSSGFNAKEIEHLIGIYKIEETSRTASSMKDHVREQKVK